MNLRNSTPESEDGDDWLERTLRERRSDDYIDDAGFTARVVHALPNPAPKNRRRTWLIAGAALLGCAIAVPGFADAMSRIDLTPLQQISDTPVALPLVVLAASLLIAGVSVYWALARRS